MTFNPSPTHLVISTFRHAAGTAVLSKHKPLSIHTTLPGHPDPLSVKGRIITVEFPGCYIIATYVTNAGEKLKVGLSDIQRGH